MKTYLKKDKGITLVALVITIIILLILAGISIAQLTRKWNFWKNRKGKNSNKRSRGRRKIKTRNKFSNNWKTRKCNIRWTIYRIWERWKNRYRNFGSKENRR